jgi:hypothetical protein
MQVHEILGTLEIGIILRLLLLLALRCRAG